MNNPVFPDDGNIPLVQDKEDYDDYNTPGTSRVDDKTSFKEHDTTEPTSTLLLRHKVKRDKIVSLYRYLDVTVLLFLDGNKHWQSITNKRTGEFLVLKTLREKFGGLNIMKSVLSLDKTPSALERLINATSKLKSELPMDLQMESIPLKELSSLVEDIHIKTREASQNTDFDMREIFGIDKALQSIQGELLNNMSKLTEIDKHIERDTKN